MNKPVSKNVKLTVLMPVFNSEKYLAQAMYSLLAQSFQQFYLYVLDDGSDDASLTVAQKIAELNPQIKVFTNQQNLGILESRQKLIDLVETEYFAWMDSDDIAPPERLMNQYQKITSDANLGVVSGLYQVLGSGVTSKAIFDPEQIDAKLIIENTVSNMAMVRTSCFKQSGFSFLTCQTKSASDYAMWSAMSDVTKIVNLPEVSNYYRLHDEQESTANYQTQCLSAKVISANSFKKLGVEVPNALIPALRLFANEQVAKNEAKQVLQLYLQVIQNNKVQARYKHKHLTKALADSYRRHCRCYGIYGVWVFISNFGLREFFTGDKLGWSFVKYCWKGYS